MSSTKVNFKMNVRKIIADIYFNNNQLESIMWETKPKRNRKIHKITRDSKDVRPT